jgi:hypothetical protein
MLLPLTVDYEYLSQVTSRPFARADETALAIEERLECFNRLALHLKHVLNEAS